MTDQQGAPGEEPLESGGSLPDASADWAEEMANETEVEEEPVSVDLVDDDEQLALARAELAERTADLQRVQAEYLNYKRRVDRDRELVRENATYAALAPITEVLDTIDRAREHALQSDESLDGGLRTVAEQLERIVAGLGLTKFGAAGDPFDPAIHDALSHIGEDPEVRGDHLQGGREGGLPDRRARGPGGPGPGGRPR